MLPRCLYCGETNLHIIKLGQSWFIKIFLEIQGIILVKLMLIWLQHQYSSPPPIACKCCVINYCLITTVVLCTTKRNLTVIETSIFISSCIHMFGHFNHIGNIHKDIMFDAYNLLNFVKKIYKRKSKNIFHEIKMT